MDVFLLYHTHDHSPDEMSKLIGVYTSIEEAESAILRILPQPGFRDRPESFEIARYSIGQDHWTEGFIKWSEA